ncbi:hypothetical protein KIN20_021896 [Parelaphostrongylus tenuis]|uniref:Uncharacterized protein n=1 Tax=Parelaphostrongylus tenuis TaxID=148309 RepID=A0AAD5MPH6_PARTN|nr:hypothetical protein KIN20_021896 [Parelaphostrongylus tenuis]
MNRNMWSGKRPIVVKRRVSPQESSTSDSRRSSNMSNRSPPCNDSLGSSTSSTRVSETILEASPSNHTLSSAITQKVSVFFLIKIFPRETTVLSAAEFFKCSENDRFTAIFYIEKGDRRVLIRRSSGSTLHRSCITQPASPSAPITLQPLARGTETVAGLAYGAALWVPLSTANDETPRRQNAANGAIEETSRSHHDLNGEYNEK